MRHCWYALALAGALGAATAPAAADLLVDNGSIPDGSGRTVSGTAVAGGWRVFQRITIEDVAWHITSIGVDGWNVLDPGGFGMLGSLIGSNEDGTPNDKDIRGTGTYFLGIDPFASNWVFDEFDATLETGTYWMMWSDNGDPGFWSAVFSGTSGESSLSQSLSSGAFIDAGATAIRIEGTIVPLPGVLSAFAVAGLGLRRRRR